MGNNRYKSRKSLKNKKFLKVGSNMTSAFKNFIDVGGSQKTIDNPFD